MRPGVIEVKTHAIPKGATQRDGHTVKRRFAGIHPRWHGTALYWKERIAPSDGQALSREIRTGGISIQRMEAIQIASIVVAVHTPKIIRRGTPRKTDIFKAGK